MRGMIILWVLLLSGCSALSSGGRAPRFLGDTGDAAILATGLAQIHEVYLTPVEIRSLAVSGLSSLTALDRALQLHEEGERLVLRYGETQTVIYAASFPRGNDSESWASVMVSAVAAARLTSPAIANASREELYKLLFSGMTARLDDFSLYHSRDVSISLRTRRESHGDIGIGIRHVGGRTVIATLSDDSPASHAGLQPGDFLLAIDGQDLGGVKPAEARELLNGLPDTQVSLTVQRGETPPQTLDLRRIQMVTGTVSAGMRGNLAIIVLERFNAGTARQIRDAVAGVKRDAGGTPIAAWVLDMRGNPGGLLDQAVAVANQLMDKKGQKIVSTAGRAPGSKQYYAADKGDILQGAPLIVLVDGFSASAAEVLAAALLDSGRAVLVGSTSLGKGSVQTVIRLPNEGELLLTWARIYGPSGYTLHHLGVMPVICTARLDGVAHADAALQAMLQSPVAQIWQGFQPLRLQASRDESLIPRLTDACPRRQKRFAGEDLDLLAAQYLANNPDLYRRALVGTP